MTQSRFAALCSVGFLARFSYALARNPVLPLFALFLGAGPEGVGLAVGISTVTGIFFKLPAGALSDVLGRRKAMLAALCVFAFMPFAYFWVSTYEGLVIVRFFHGFATAIYGPVAMAVVAELAGERRGEMLSWFSSVMIIGTLIGAPMGGFILSLWQGGSGTVAAQGFHWVYALVAISGLGALALGAKILLQDVAPPVSVDENGSSRWARFTSGIRQVGGDRRVLAASATEGVQNMAMGALEAFLPVYAVTVVGLSAWEAGLLWAVQIVATMLAKPLMGRISDKYGRTPLIVAGLLCCAVPFALIPHLRDFTTLLFACLIFGLGEALVTSSTAALVADICKVNQYGTAMGVFGTIFDVGHAAGPILGGILISTLGYTWAFLILAGILIVAIPCFLRQMRPDIDTTAGTAIIKP